MIERHVVQRPDGSWATIAPNAKRASSIHPTQTEAIPRAKEIVSNAGGGEVRIHSRDGHIRDNITIPSGNDPCPPKDKR